ncbi:D-alanyl-D-alanine carboxypeptidase family protein [Patescibacteria group bacterium]
MVSSFLSLYIASAMQPGIENQAIDIEAIPTKTSVEMTNFDISDLLNNNLKPIKKPQFVAPIINASSSISMDLNTGAVLYEKEAHQRRPLASITKLMTILIILDENKLEEEVIVSSNAANTEGSTMYLVAGERITVENLLKGALIQSANDAAVALAEFNAGNVNSFIEKMNKKALDLGLINTHYENPTGLDQPNNYSSAYDIAKLAQHIYSYNFITQTAPIQNMEVKSVNGRLTHKLEATNELLDSYLNIKGLKTGRTQAAGLCLVAVAENENKNQIISVVLNSPDRFKESKILLDWVFRAFNWPT